MTALAPLLQAFFTDRLIAQRRASSHTIAGYRVSRTSLGLGLHPATQAIQPSGRHNHHVGTIGDLRGFVARCPTVPITLRDKSSR